MKQIILTQNNYFNSKIELFGFTQKGLDYNGSIAQKVRFDQLYKLIQKDNNFTINDFGAGLGHFAKYLLSRKKKFNYYGNDINKLYINEAIKNFIKFQDKIKFTCSENIKQSSDYSIACGVFNNIQNLPKADWLEYISMTLEKLNKKSIKGFAFNMLTRYSDQDKMRKDLFYADPLFYFDFCKKNYSKNVALLHDYNLYDFTILVKK